MEIYPLKLKSITKSPIWGGVRLLGDWGKQSDAPTVGESWELTVRKNEMAVVENGIYEGKPLSEVIASFGTGFVAPGVGNEEFPLLIKLIDASDRLSVQVHPDDSYAKRVENDRGKTEMWVIVEADEGAEIICGLTDGSTSEDFARAVRDGDVGRVLKHQKVHAGEVYFIPAGLAHAIGKGILIAEIQQNCDLTYRIFDYNRRGADGKLRELHVEKALDVVRPYTKEEIEAIRFEALEGEKSDALLAWCRYFKVEKVGAGILPASPKMRHLLCIGGKGELVLNGKSYPVVKGDSYLLPPCGEVTVTGNLHLIQSQV